MASLAVPREARQFSPTLGLFTKEPRANCRFRVYLSYILLRN